MKPYVGIEAEGRFTGMRTLFVPLYRNLLPTTIDEDAREHRCPHVYLGVKGTYLKAGFHYRALQYLVNCGLCVTREVDFRAAGALSQEELESPQTRYLLTLSPDTPWSPNAPLDPILAVLERPNVELKIDGELKTAVYWRSPQIVPLHYCRDKEV